jgi:hypothetical protein
MEGKELFRHTRSDQGAYIIEAHLAEMIALLGPPPKVLVDREKAWSDVRWSRAFLNLEGKLCHTAREYYGGPFFDSNGKFPRICDDTASYLRTNQTLTLNPRCF